MYLFGTVVACSILLIALAEVDGTLVGARAARDAVQQRLARYVLPSAEEAVRADLARQVALAPAQTTFTFAPATLEACPSPSWASRDSEAPLSALPSAPCPYVAQYSADQEGTTGTGAAGSLGGATPPASPDETSYNVNAAAHEQRVAVRLSVRVGWRDSNGQPRAGVSSASAVERLTFRTYGFSPFASLVSAGDGTIGIASAGDPEGCSDPYACGDRTLLDAYVICTPPAGESGAAHAAAVAWCKRSAGGTPVGTTASGAVILRVDADRNVRWFNANGAPRSWSP